MRIESSFRNGALLGALAILIALPTAAEAQAPSARDTRCDRPSSSTLVETGKVRVFAMPPESLQSAGNGLTAIGGRPVFGCLKATGRAVLLNFPVEGHPFWASVDDDPIAVDGPLVAYVFGQYYTDFHKTWIRVRNLNTGAFIRNCPIGGAMAPSTLPHVTDIVLGSDGDVEWKAQGEGPELSEHPIPGCNPAG
jgi:hypothetical protein